MASPETGFLAETSSLNYPLVGPGVPAALRKFLADSYISYEPSLLPNGLANATLTLNSISLSGGHLALTVKLSNGTTLYTAASAAPVSSWGSWVIYQWIATGITLRLTAKAGAADFTAAGPYALGISSVHVRARKLKRILVKQAYTVNNVGEVLSGPADFALTGDVPMICGYNLDSTAGQDPQTDVSNPDAPPAVRPSSLLTLNCTPDGGQGRFPTCLDSTLNTVVLRNINGVTGDVNGNLNLELTDCYRSEREVEFVGTPPATNPRRGTTTPGHLWLIGDCGACSKCQQYADLYKLLRKLYLRAAGIQASTIVAANNYENYRTLSNVLQTNLSEPSGLFRVIQNAANVYTLHVTLDTGLHAFNQIHVVVTPPPQWTPTYIPFNSWEKLPNMRDHQNEALMAATQGTGFTVHRTFPKQSRSWWHWSMSLAGSPQLEAQISSSLGNAAATSSSDMGCPQKPVLPVQFQATITAREIMPNGTFRSWTWGPLTREVEAQT